MWTVLKMIDLTELIRLTGLTVEMRRISSLMLLPNDVIVYPGISLYITFVRRQEFN
jgi:hypothetical protein